MEAPPIFLPSYCVCDTALGLHATSKESSYTKNEYYTISIEIRWWTIFFLKKAVFSEKTVTNYFGATFNNLLGKGRGLSQKLT